jgi:hypothetical protein
VYLWLFYMYLGLDERNFQLFIMINSNAKTKNTYYLHKYNRQIKSFY